MLQRQQMQCPAVWPVPPPPHTTSTQHCKPTPRVCGRVVLAYIQCPHASPIVDMFPSYTPQLLLTPFKLVRAPTWKRWVGHPECAEQSAATYTTATYIHQQVRMARVPEQESQKWCGHSCWPMYHDVNNNNNNQQPLTASSMERALTWKRWATPGALRWEALHRGVWVAAS
jgi:hypothetical protein